MMNPQLKLDDIEQRVVSVLHKLGKRPRRWHHPKCTHEVMKATGGLGERLRFVVASPDSKVGQDHEWLYDLCWCEEKDGFVLNLPLALECEWAQDFVPFWTTSKNWLCRVPIIAFSFARNSWSTGWIAWRS